MNGNVDIIVQARMGSSRLPGKMMLDFCGKPLLVRILERLRECKTVSTVVLAIPDDEVNNLLAIEASMVEGVQVYRGSEQNLIQRYIGAAELYETDYIVRFPADNPFPDPFLIDQLVDFHLSENPLGFSSNIASVLGNNMIDGLGAEIFSADLLKKARMMAPTAEQTEHIHLNFYNYYTGEPRDNTFCNIDAPFVIDELRKSHMALDVNTLEQFVKLRKIQEKLIMLGASFSYTDTIKVAEGML